MAKVGVTKLINSPQHQPGKEFCFRHLYLRWSSLFNFDFIQVNAVLSYSMICFGSLVFLLEIAAPAVLEQRRHLVYTGPWPAMTRKIIFKLKNCMAFNQGLFTKLRLGLTAFLYKTTTSFYIKDPGPLRFPDKNQQWTSCSGKGDFSLPNYWESTLCVVHSYSVGSLYQVSR